MPPAPIGRATTRSQPRTGPRWAFHYHDGEKLTCPRGHHLPFTVQRVERGLVQCDHQPPPNGNACGIWVYIANQRDLGLFAIAVDPPEIPAVEACHSPREVFHLLGVRFA